ncbi:MAG: Trp family transcriptional regulator [Candidatus Nomurabacteria bacterium]|nr:Trp family transcriptional regulator [Candidatus Nomurabacteria bacterium]
MKNNSEQYKKEVLDIIYKIAKDKNLLESFMQDILTPKEYDNVGVRWQIVKKLAKGEKHEYIASDLKLGVATVTRGSREMRNKDGGFQKVLKFLKLK